MSVSLKFCILLAAFFLVACIPEPLKISEGHIREPVSPPETGDIPSPVLDAPTLPPPKTQRPDELFTVVVHDVPVRELLFALARDAQINVDIGPGISGPISINAIDQSLIQILERLKRQVNLRYRLENELLIISQDTPYFVHYSVPYINIVRSSSGEVNISTQIAATGTGASDGGGGGGDNNSSTQIKNTSDNKFWDTLIANMRSILQIGDSAGGPGGNSSTSKNSGVGANSGAGSPVVVAANPESGIISVNATQKQHGEIQRYLDKVLEHVRRQVLIEATVVEVQLGDHYQAGVDWSLLADNNKATFTQSLVGANLAASPFFSLAYTGTDLAATVKLLDEFGTTKVLSSPKLMVLNNQTALLKVVDNRVYFTTTVETDTTQGVSVTTFETKVHTIPVGFVMSVTPQISRDRSVIINARPTISRIIRFVSDPNPALAVVGTENLIPEIQVREMESILKIQDGDIGIIGGLMQDDVGESTSGVPFLDRIPYLGNLFSFKDNDYKKTELVIFIRPQVIESASLDSELRRFKNFLDAPASGTQ